MISMISACATDDFQKSRKMQYFKKCDISKKRKMSALSNISSVLCFSMSVRYVYNHPNFNLIKTAIKSHLSSKKVDFSIFEPQKYEVELNCFEAPLNFRLLICTNFGKNSFQFYNRLVGKISLKSVHL